jgi:hypothetical protein
MDYIEAIEKHKLHIANHQHTNDVLANMKIQSVKRISPSDTLQTLAQTYKDPMLFLRKEAFGWRFRILKGLSTKTYGNNNQFTYTNIDKMSYLIQTQKWAYGNGWSQVNKDEYQVSGSFSITVESFMKFTEAFMDLKDFVFSFIDNYRSIKEATDAIVKQQKELKKAA